MAVQLKQAEQVTALESQCHNVTEELQSHIMGIQEQLMKMLGAQWYSLFKSKGPSQADFDAKIEKGASVQVNQYMLDILSSL